MKLAVSLTNMLGEFVAIQKSPEFKPCSASMQELDRAIKEEKKEYTLKVCEIPYIHSVVRDRCVPQEVSSSPCGRVTMRPTSEKRRDRPSSLVERFVQRISPSRPTEVSFFSAFLRFLRGMISPFGEFCLF
ncbi:unnamed protein product [Haemonchus placei]|uniref:Ras-associating domain-containing protein n=1 Tax=Haemonchus placei TaxID=6290 RepID=A0A0N4W6E2_HAEPC|nr:unnamed protein product [Haemonchus placei]